MQTKKSDRPVFNPNARCTKCGCSDVSARYDEDPSGYTVSKWPAMWMGEQITRCCRRCGWRWSEQCLPDNAASDPVADDLHSTLMLLEHTLALLTLCVRFQAVTDPAVRSGIAREIRVELANPILAQLS